MRAASGILASLASSGLPSASTKPVSSPMVVLPPASRYGALAAPWSRSAIIMSLGLSGLPVFQAGHCSWQRPHSVQVEKSSQPFHEKSSMAPAPRTGSKSSSSSVLASIFSMVSASPSMVMGLSAPSAVRPSASRLK